MRQESRSYTQSDLSRGFAIVEVDDYLQKTGGETTWSYLHYTNTESRDIMQLLEENQIPSVLYSGVKGNKESFFGLDGKRTMVIHLATHGFFNQDIERNYDDMDQMIGQRGRQSATESALARSGLVLSGANTWAQEPMEGVENGVLLADEVARMNLLGADLVVLSACETALGEVDNSEGVFGLQRAFKLAGAQTLIMSLWKVDDEATSILISDFYRNWFSGMSKQEALNAAQKTMCANPRYALPFYWSAFVMMD
jgi:CHAT domain-containing protein